MATTRVREVNVNLTGQLPVAYLKEFQALLLSMAFYIIFLYLSSLSVLPFYSPS